MIHEEYDIQRQADALMNKVLEMWKREGKWDGDNPNAPFYGLEKDPMINLLLTAFVHQSNAIEKELKELNAGLMSEFEDMVLPYKLTQAVPSFSMLTTAKVAGNDEDCYVDENSPFFGETRNHPHPRVLSFPCAFQNQNIGCQDFQGQEIVGGQMERGPRHQRRKCRPEQYRDLLG